MSKDLRRNKPKNSPKCLASGFVNPAGQFFTQTAYDDLGRIYLITQPDDSVTVMNYKIHLLGSLPTSVTYSQDANGNTSEAWADAFGRLLKIQGATGPAVTYTYDPADHLTSALYGNALTQISYDIAGRKITLDDPDMGLWNYAYDALGNLTQQTDARGCLTTLAYDGLNRLTGKSYSNASGGNCAAIAASTPAVTYGYDAGTYGKLQRTSMSDASGSTAWTYDNRGQVTSESRTISGVNYLTSWTFNSAGLVASQTYPGGEVVTSTYLPQMKLASLSGTNNYLVSASYDAAGRLSSRSLGNTLTQSFGYYGWNETDENITGNLSGGGLKSIQTGTLQNLQYTHDATGNILTINDLLNSQVQTFVYDDLNRLTSAAAAGGQNGVYSETYTYNATTGNLDSKGTTTYGYNDSAHDHAVTHLDSVLKYGYDANGNQVQRGTNTLTYDAENRLVSVSGGVTATFVYDGDGNRVQGTVNGVTTVFVNSSYEVSGGIATSYYIADGQRIAMRKSGVVSYILPDHLGSTMLTTNSSGVRTSEQWYEAFGEERYTYGTLPTDRQYTSQDHETGLGLYFYNARWYDDSLGRFIQADTIVPGNKGFYSPLLVDYHEIKFLEHLNEENRKRPEDSQANSLNVPTNPFSFDRYTYANNNPLRYTDPDGHFAFLVPLLAGALIGGAISTAVYALTASVSGREITLSGAAGAFAGGAIAGAVSVIATPLAGTLLHAAGMAASGTALVAGTAAVNAVGGAASYLTGGYTQNAVDITMGNSPTFKPTIVGALFNAGVAGILSPVVGNKFPVSNNTISTIKQASHFMPGRTIPTLFVTQNARNLYSQALIATGIGAFAGIMYAE